MQGVIPEIFLPGPPSPKMAPARMPARVAHWRADRSLAACSTVSRFGSMQGVLSVIAGRLRGVSHEGPQGDVDEAVYIVEGSQLGYGMKAAWNVCF